MHTSDNENGNASRDLSTSDLQHQNGREDDKCGPGGVSGGVVEHRCQMTDGSPAAERILQRLVPVI